MEQRDIGDQSIFLVFVHLAEHTTEVISTKYNEELLASRDQT
jgi:hypothetical protein